MSCCGMRNRRGEATKKILERLEKGPAFPKQLSDELGICLSTVNHNLHRLLYLNIVKKVHDGKYAVKWFDSEKYKIENAYQELSSVLVRNPTPEEVAGRISETPSITRELLFKFIPNYFEPTENEIQADSKRAWWALMIAVLDFPKPQELIDEGVEELSVKGMDELTFKVLFRSRDEIVENYRKARPVKLKLFKEFYLSGNPNIVPSLKKYRIGDTLYLEVIWSKFAESRFHKIPEFNATFRAKLNILFKTA